MPDGKEKAGKVKRGMQRMNRWMHGAGMRSLLLMIVAGVAIFALSCTVCISNRYSLEVGDISDRNIEATKEVEDRYATEAERNRAAAAIGPSYHLDEAINEQVLTDLNQILDEMRMVQQYGQTLRNERQTGSSLTVFTQEEKLRAQEMVKRVNLTLNQVTVLMRTDNESFENMSDTVVRAVSDALENTILAGQLPSAINNIIYNCRVNISLELSTTILQTLVNATVKANMLVDDEATAQARARARESVLPVTYKQGQFIVREGDEVTASQLEMLGELGLLTSSGFSFNVYGGAMLLTVSALVLLWFLLKLLEPQTLTDCRSMLVILLVMLISEGLSAFCITVINVYLSPVALCGILLTALFGPRVGLSSGLSITVIVAGLSAASSNTYNIEMISLLLTGVISNVVAVRFLAGRPQRVSVVVCGALVGAANAVVLMAIGLMTAVHLDNTVAHAVWTVASGLLSGLIAVGLQPVLETPFNLATPSKLLELANPNHPLLRRLLMEAPGTYHHSIIVANLAEAAAEEIGANMLMARTGAYFHDIGKLKRPMYFKENQRGDNPHDRTDAYISAAIVTAHTRDGALMAQKYHLPQEIQRIILEHHGDTPVMYFYHKALQQAQGKPVDVKDFRYGGSRPGTKESAIVMLADTIEAAVRSMSDPTPQAIESFIERLVRGKINDGQLSDSPLSLHDIDGICAAFIKVLRGVFHERIEYPNVQIEQIRNADAVPAAEEEKQPADEASADEAPAADSVSAEEGAMPEPYAPPMPDGLLLTEEEPETAPEDAGEETK